MLFNAARRTYLSVGRKLPQYVCPFGDAAHHDEWVDLRSDTTTRPDEKMKHAMANSVLGDDGYGDCPTTNKLQSDMAALLGKEDALLVSSGCQANLISLMLMAPTRGQAVLIGDKSHIATLERGGIATLAGTMPRILPNEDDGTIDLKALEDIIPKYDDVHIVPVMGICLENTHGLEGRVLTPEY